MNSKGSCDVGETLRVYWKFVILNLKLDLSVWFCIFLQTCSMAWYRKRVGGDLDFIRVVVKSKFHRVVKQERSIGVKGVCGAVITVIVVFFQAGYSCAKEVLINGSVSTKEHLIECQRPHVHLESCPLKTSLGQKNYSRGY